MTIHTTGSEAVPDPKSAPRATLPCSPKNLETGFWDDDQGRPAPWPEDIDEWTPSRRQAATWR